MMNRLGVADRTPQFGFIAMHTMGIDGFTLLAIAEIDAHYIPLRLFSRTACPALMTAAPISYWAWDT